MPPVAARRALEITMAKNSSGGSKRALILLSSMVGTALEQYDFLLYGAAASLIFNKLFFPALANLQRDRYMVASFTCRLPSGPGHCLGWGTRRGDFDCDRDASRDRQGLWGSFAYFGNARVHPDQGTWQSITRSDSGTAARIPQASVHVHHLRNSAW